MPLEHGTPASQTRRLAQRALDRWGLTAQVDDVLLVATELVQNVTKHTTDGGEFRLAVTDGTILIEVTDTNPAPPRIQEVTPQQAGGRGMLLIAAVSRRWGTRPAVWSGHTGKVVWAELVSAHR